MVMRAPVRWALLYALLIIGLSSIPGSSYPNVRLLSYDKVIHFTEYAIFGVLISRVLVVKFTSFWALLVAVVLIAALFGAADELYQRLIPGRDASVGDWVADVAGSLVGSLVILRLKIIHDQAALDQ